MPTRARAGAGSLQAAPRLGDPFRFYNEAIARKAPRTENMRSLIDFFKDWDECETGGVYSQRASNRYPARSSGTAGLGRQSLPSARTIAHSAASASRAAPLARWRAPSARTLAPGTRSPEIRCLVFPPMAAITAVMGVFGNPL
jgi:hypothetical protein